MVVISPQDPLVSCNSIDMIIVVKYPFLSSTLYKTHAVALPSLKQLLPNYIEQYFWLYLQEDMVLSSLPEANQNRHVMDGASFSRKREQVAEILLGI